MLTVLMPSRGREQQASEAYDAFLLTKSLPDTNMVIVLDEGEPGYKGLPVIRAIHDGGMGNALNAGMRQSDGDIYGFVGDDHYFLTPGWDTAIIAANEEIGGGIVYGNDLIRGEELPSQVFIDARITYALGWMALPGATHLYFDDTWRELGRRMGRLRYLPDIHIEHRHPTVGKADWDDNYLRVNAPEMYDHDRAIYEAWLRTSLASDAQIALAAVS
jgi:glycosyltransferase involved in cell wall biosynthesis